MHNLARLVGDNQFWPDETRNYFSRQAVAVESRQDRHYLKKKINLWSLLTDTRRDRTCLFWRNTWCRRQHFLRPSLTETKMWHFLLLSVRKINHEIYFRTFNSWRYTMFCLSQSSSTKIIWLGQNYSFFFKSILQN